MPYKVEWTRAEDWYGVLQSPRDGRESAMSDLKPPCEISWFSALCDDDYEFLGVPDAAS